MGDGVTMAGANAQTGEAPGGDAVTVGLVTRGEGGHRGPGARSQQVSR